ncbi:MAG: HD domain-containing protein [Chitinivibrionales bacterium]|nr:HD domain-containing protein [Chitinivibrionales bacterium]
MPRTSDLDIRKILLSSEDNLSPFARKSAETQGRKFPLKKDPFRLEFARDETRILHSPPFRRLKHKTQVFLSPNNDHICTRMEHVLHVSSIASVIGRCLNLNADLISAIAKGHDLGHPPFGHAGEKVLNFLVVKEGVKEGFKHEMHGLRVVDSLTNYGDGLNLTFEVRDGIITHCGEKFDQSVSPDRSRDLSSLESITDRNNLPATLEGCVVRMVDRVAYLGRDLEDGIKAGFVGKQDIPTGVAKHLGADNGKIIGRFVNDIVANSFDQDTIQMSDGIFDLMQQLKEFNYERIYRHPAVAGKSRRSDRIIEQLYDKFVDIMHKSERGANSDYVNQISQEAPASGVFFSFIKNKSYTNKTSARRIVVDYIAGMTDIFAQRSYVDLFLPTPVV